MSIKFKVLISNILTFLLPVIVGLISLNIAFHAIDKTFPSEDYFEIIEQIDSNVLNEDYENAISNAKKIEELGYSVNLTINNIIRFESKNYNEYSEKVIGDYVNEDGNFTIINQSGEASYILIGDEKLKPETDHLSIISREIRGGLEEQKANIKRDKEYVMKIILFVLVSIVCTVIFTTLVMTFIIVKSILKPLNLLRQDTNQIMEGNINFSLKYEKEDEFGELFNDFAIMKKKLLQAKEEENKYQESRKELIAGITHDLNTPLTSIKGYTSGILDGVADTKEKQIYYLEKINSVSNEMSQLINELFLYSTLDMNKVNFDFTKTDLVEYFNDCLLEVENQYRKKSMNIEFLTQLKSNEAYSNIDLIHFKRVVLNILNNSAKYKKYDYVNVLIMLREDKECYIISFKDDGIGVPKEKLENIFEVFFRFDKSRNKEKGGCGLGLAIVRNIVLAHGGSIDIGTESNEGLELILNLPKA